MKRASVGRERRRIPTTRARTQYVHVVRDDYGGSAYTHRNAITTSSLLPPRTDAPTKTLNVDLWDANLGGGGSETLQWLPNSRPSGLTSRAGVVGAPSPSRVFRVLCCVSASRVLPRDARHAQHRLLSPCLPGYTRGGKGIRLDARRCCSPRVRETGLPFSSSVSFLPSSPVVVGAHHLAVPCIHPPVRVVRLLFYPFPIMFFFHSTPRNARCPRVKKH